MSSIQQDLAKYLLEMSLLEYDCAHFPPSLMADASLCLSLMIIEEDASLDIWTSTLQKYSTYTADEIVPVVCKLAFVLTKRKKCQLQAVHTKYLGEKFNGVGKLKQEATQPGCGHKDSQGTAQPHSHLRARQGRQGD